jgi:Family of unknown function (DUF5906)
VRKPLQPKAQIRNTHPLLDDRLAMAANGWSMCPCTLKTRTCKNWPRMACDAHAIETMQEWRDKSFAGTAVRISGDLAVIDVDISIQSVADAVLDELYAIGPDAYVNCIRRDSGRASLALFFRTDQPFGAPHPPSYTASADLEPQLEAAYAMPETTEEEHEAKRAAIGAIKAQLDPQKVEFYGPLSKGRYFQMQGPHSEGREYRCHDRAPWNTRVEDLPLLPASLDTLWQRVNAVLARHLTLIPEPPETAAEVVYDLKPDTRFYPKDGDSETVADLTRYLPRGAENGIRGCLASTLRGSRSMSNCNLYVTTTGRVAVTNFANNGQIHYMADQAPDVVDTDALGLALSQLEQRQEDAAANDNDDDDDDAQYEPPRRSAPMDNIERVVPVDNTPESKLTAAQQTCANAIMWLLDNVAYCANAFRGKGGAISIQPDGEIRAFITLGALKERMQSYGYWGFRPGSDRRSWINPVDGWSRMTQRVCVEGVRMRPELPCPIFKENGETFINRYVVPAHPAAGGTIKPFLRRMENLFPSDAERAWMINFLATKVQHPEWRMIAPVHVARDNGTGRGLLQATLGLLFGKEFVVSIPYAKVSGGSGSRFNSEVENKLIVCINESRDADQRNYAGRSAAREMLKEFIEPNHEIPFRVEPKGMDAYFTLSAATTLIFSNNNDALPLNDADRRSAVMLGGEQMTPREIDDYRAWMAQPTNIGALFRYLRDFAVETDRTVFDPYMAPAFEGRDLMIDAGKTELDIWWEEATERLKVAAELYTMSQVVATVRRISGKQLGNSHFDELIRKHTRVSGFRIGIKHSKNWHIRYGDGEDNKERVYAHSESARKKWTRAGPHEIKAELDKAQKVVGAGEEAFRRGLRAIDGGLSHKDRE